MNCWQLNYLRRSNLVWALLLAFFGIYLTTTKLVAQTFPSISRSTSNLDEQTFSKACRGFVGIDHEDAKNSKYLSRFYNEGSRFFVPYRVEIKAHLHIEETQSTSIVLTNFRVAKASPSIAKEIAQAEVEKYSGRVTMDFVTIKEHLDLVRNDPRWKGLGCVVRGAKKLTVETGGYKTTVVFSPPIPIRLNTNATQEQLQVGLSQSRVWKRVKAEIVSTDHPNLETGQIIRGSAKLYRDSSHRHHEMIHLETEFENPEIVNAIGLRPLTSYQIDLSHQKLETITIDVKDSLANGPTKFSPL